MPFLIYTVDKPNHEAVRDRHRAAHYAHLEAHQARLMISGGLRNAEDSAFIGGAILYDTDSREEVERFVAEDPFTVANLFARVEIMPWKAAFIGGKSVRTPTP